MSGPQRTAIPSTAQIERAVAMLDGWLDGMRGPSGYGGPVVHWWRDSLLYCGPGLDWRYEGIIAGYLTLFERTGRADFLEKAKRAGEDLIGGQLDDHRFRNSSFERNPSPGGTPHEAAADVGLLLLAKTLRDRSDVDGQRYLRAAELNIDAYQLVHRWREDQRRFIDGGDWFVPNKAATMIEAWCLLAELTERTDYLSAYVAPTADAILAHQVDDPRNPLDGAIAQASTGRSRVEKYFPLYVARCIPGLCAAFRSLGDVRYLDAAVRAGRFLVRWRDDDGGSCQVLYPEGRRNRYPRWIAGAAEMVRAWNELAAHGFVVDAGPTIRWILDGQLSTGAIRSAEGFAFLTRQRWRARRPDIRDFLPVVGWNDKAFRLLAGMVESQNDSPGKSAVELECSWRKKAVRYREDDRAVSVEVSGQPVYRWTKASSWAMWNEGQGADGR